MKPILLILFGALSTNLVAQSTLNLRQCIQRAEERNLQLRQADIDRRRADIALNSSRNARLPDISAGANQSIAFGRGLTASNTYASRTTSSTGISVNGSIPLLTGGRIGHERERARLNLDAAVADIERLREDLGLRIARAYLQVLYNNDLVARAETDLDLARKQEAQLASRIAAGKTAQVERDQAVARVARCLLALTDADNNRRTALLDLSQLLDFDNPDSVKVAPLDEQEVRPLVGSAEEIYRLALPDRPAYRVANLRVRAAEKSVDLARSAYYPTLSLSAGMGTNYYRTSGVNNLGFSRQFKDNFAQNIGLQLNIPIFNGHATRNNVRQARLDVQQRQLDLETYKRALYKEIQDAFYSATGAYTRYTSALAAETAAKTAFNTVAAKYEAGRANAAELDEAQTNYRNASIDRISAFYECHFRNKIINFYRGEPL